MDPLKYISQKAMATGKLDKCQMLLSEFDIVYMTQKAIKAQALADHLAENPIDEEYKPLKTYFHDEEVSFVGDDISEAYPGWISIFDGATNRQDATSNQKKSIRRMALNFFIHAGVCDTHMNRLTLARKILRAGCQVHGDLIRVPPHELNVSSSPWPFVAWGMDFIGPIETTTSNGHKFILVANDYFTKWVEEASYKFRVPKSIITDNGANINSHLMRDICEKFKVTHQNSTAYRPQMNRAIEATNKNIKKILRKMIDKHRGWHEMLPYALLGYRTTVKTSTGATPYLLVYGTEAVIPVEVEIPSLRIIQEAELSNAEWVSKRIDQLTLFDEKRMVVVYHGQLYRQIMIRAIHKRAPQGFDHISRRISIPLYNRNWHRIFERDSKILEKKILPQQVKTEDVLRFATGTEISRMASKFKHGSSTSLE
ncbi:uncharacterized protein [Solanum lycopersicum]|uniref:uncharacterized protein n=1 Tax=Solanum lycopersicum TaxID=4081 RepID=UPI0037492445